MAWAALAVVLGASAAAQVPPPDPGSAEARRIDERIQALRAEADSLASRSRTLLEDLRALELERNLRSAESQKADAAVADAEAALAAATERVGRLERDRDAQIPAIRAQLVHLYKHGRAGYGEMIFAAQDLRDLGRAVRAVAALAESNHRRLLEHQRTLDALQVERAALEEQREQLVARQREANAARVAAGRAVKAHAARIAEIDARRDLTARYVGELQVARQRLLEQLEDRTTTATVPLPPFRGALEWPVDGTLRGRFNQTRNRLGGTAVRNGIDITAPLDTAVRAIHHGTVAHAGPFTGFGTLVIVDHGGNHFSLYGYLSSVAVAAGDTVERGATVGRVGNAPAGPSALYFELRIDGQAVDPVQWLEPR